MARNLSVFLWGGRDVRGKILRTENFFFFFPFYSGVIGGVFASFGGVWLDVFTGNLCLVLSIRKCYVSIMFF